MRGLKRASRRLAIGVAALAAVACAGTPEASTDSGFLENYSQLEPGRGDQAQLVYIDPEADFSVYERVLVDPVVVWQPTTSGQASDEKLRKLAGELEEALRAQLAREFKLVDRPQPGTLRIRTAITDVRHTAAAIELEVVDAMSGHRLVAVDDARSGPEAYGPKREWDNAREAFEFWAKRARVRLAAFRSFDAAEAAHEARSER